MYSNIEFKLKLQFHQTILKSYLLSKKPLIFFGNDRRKDCEKKIVSSFFQKNTKQYYDKKNEVKYNKS